MIKVVSEVRTNTHPYYSRMGKKENAYIFPDLPAFRRFGPSGLQASPSRHTIDFQTRRGLVVSPLSGLESNR